MIHVGVSGGLLRRHVGRGAQRHAERGQGRLTAGGGDRLGDAEIGHHGVTIGEQHVVGLDIAVHDTVAVGVGKGVYHLAQDLGRLRDGQLSFPRQLGPERLARDVRHDVVQQIARSGGGEQRDDVRVLQSGGELDLPLEPLDIDRGTHVGREQLDDHLASQPGFLGEEDTAHPSAAQFFQDAVGITQSGLQPGLETDGGFQGEGS
jgi:hypothetical protein